MHAASWQMACEHNSLRTLPSNAQLPSRRLLLAATRLVADSYHHKVIQGSLILWHTVGLIVSGPAEGPARKGLLLRSSAQLVLSDTQQKALTALLNSRGNAMGTSPPTTSCAAWLPVTTGAGCGL